MIGDKSLKDLFHLLQKVCRNLLARHLPKRGSKPVVQKQEGRGVYAVRDGPLVNTATAYRPPLWHGKPEDPGRPQRTPAVDTDTQLRLNAEKLQTFDQKDP